MMAATAGAAPSTRLPRLQIPPAVAGAAIWPRIEHWLEAERDQLPLWLPVVLGGGIAAWFVLPDPRHWIATLSALAAVALAALAAGRGDRASRAIGVGAAVAMLGLGLAWWRAERVAAPVLARPAVVRVTGTIELVEPLPARGLVRLTVAPFPASGLPERLRVNVDAAALPHGASAGETVTLTARLMPPPAAAVPGAYDFARVAWFAGIGGTGRAFGPVAQRGGDGGGSWRAMLTRHITDRLEGSRGGIAAALATGDEGAITQDDSDAMRRAGLAHLLSVSGLHITAAVAATMLLVMRLLALWPWLALRVRLPLVAAAAGAAAAIGYTLLTGSQVPTIRSCVASLLVIGALALGRQAMTLRLVAAGAGAVLLVWPEALVGPSFQLSFAAIGAIVALHEHPRIAAAFLARDEPRWRQLVRSLASLLLTGFVVEAALMPIAVYHFHKAGLYGAIANLVAIPLTTFVVMPLEALALLCDLAGLGGPVWWLTDGSLRFLLWLAHRVAALPGSATAIATVPTAAFALCVLGGLWLALWRTPPRWLGVLPLGLGCVWILASPPPDLLVTGDGRHLAARTGGGLSILRDRAGDYTRAMLSETGGIDGEPAFLADSPAARCSRDACTMTLDRGGRRWRVLATRSPYPLPWGTLIAACRQADIVISERRLPRGCVPRWLKLDGPVLARTGGVTVTLATRQVVTVREAGDAHPWLHPPVARPAAAVLYRPDRWSGQRRAERCRGSGCGRHATYRHDKVPATSSR